jgi:UPF0755 protein
MSRFVIYLIFTIIIIGGIFSVGGTVNYNYFEAPTDSPKGNVEVEIKSGETIRSLGQKLVDQKILKNVDALVFQNQINPVSSLQVGVINLKTPAKPADLIIQLQDETVKLAKVNKDKANKPAATITFKEGETLDQMIVKIEKAGVSNVQELSKVAKSPDYFDKTKWEFLPEILECQYGLDTNCAKYYIEGYLYPDTYSFFKDSKPEEVFAKMLDNFKAKVWNKLSSKVDKQTFTKAVIMASVLEKETGRPVGGVNSSNIDELNKERRLSAGVFYNRLKNNMKWASNPTVAYWTGQKVCEQTIKINNCIFLDSPEAINRYNTYRNTGYPIGPITSPQFDNISAALNPEETSYLYFVADNNGVTYFAESDIEHEANIEKVKAINGVQ